MALWLTRCCVRLKCTVFCIDTKCSRTKCLCTPFPSWWFALLFHSLCCCILGPRCYSKVQYQSLIVVLCFVHVLSLQWHEFKTRYNNHKLSFKDWKHSHNTVLLKHIWDLKDKSTSYKMKWQIKARAIIPFHPTAICVYVKNSPSWPLGFLKQGIWACNQMLLWKHVFTTGSNQRKHCTIVFDLKVLMVCL